MKIQKTAIIIDDEAEARENLKWQLKNFCPDVTLVGEAGSVAAAVNLLQKVSCDLIFLDIELSDGSGFDLLSKVRPLLAEVVFVTGYDQYAIKAFQYSAIGYIMKPPDPEILAATVAKVQPKIENFIDARINLLLENYQQKKIKKIALPNQGGIEIIATNEILYFEASENYSYVTLDTQQKKLLVSKNIGELDKMLPENFYRAHKSFLVNIDHIKRFTKNEGNFVYMSNQQEIPVARRRKDQLIELLGHL